MATTTRRTRKATTKPADTTELTTTPDPATPTGDQTTGAPDTPTVDETTGTPATDPTEAPPAPGSDTPDDNGATGDGASDTPADAPVSGAPVSGAPVGSADHFKIVMVAGVLGDHPDGVSAADIADESGLRAAIVGRVLAAMETAGAAVREPATTDDGEPDPNGAELWVRGEADLTTVDLTAAAVRVVCPTCNRPMPRRNTVAVGRTGPAAPGHNSDGQPVLGKGELRNLVRDFLAAHPGHEFTPTVIGRELGRSSGAIGNALDKLVISGEAVLVKDAPRIFAAPPTAAPADTARNGVQAPTGK